MNGSIRNRGKGTWERTVDLGRDSGGKRKRKFVNVKGTKTQAQQKLRELLTSLDRAFRSVVRRYPSGSGCQNGWTNTLFQINAKRPLSVMKD